ncbi:DUF2291 domain-containing protein [Algoriphagus sp. H41]|uniref:DUF2291 domain-containing protein n=1 Tax=Algoriphagus oliviformis TaxID=2811231 RepID=A0ABS3C1F4_9BACT|nr:DUF2291 domain-containing protein [Algoriphagus oliviformis]MBN7810783.1 DUF2291 domain-containing protein [Algoriphagus oliviformis]
MKQRAIKYLIGMALLALLGYNSVYFQPLDERLAANQKEVFDAAAYVESIWDTELAESYGNAPDFSQLLTALATDPEGTFEKSGNALGIGNIGYFRVKGEGTVTSVDENHVLLQVGDKSVEIETEFIYGNALRDASGLVKINDYPNTSDFNTISEEINARIRHDLIPTFRSSLAVGDRVEFEGAMELNKAHLNLQRPEIIPFTLKINP